MTFTDDFDEPGIGHNKPPTLIEALREKHRELFSRVDELTATALSVPAVITDDTMQGKVGDTVDLISALVSKADAERVKEKEPHLTAGRVVDAFFKSIADAMAPHKATLLKRSTVYLLKKQDEEKARRAEEERIALAEAERLAQIAASDADLDRAIVQEAAAIEATKAVQATPADMVRTRGDYGSVSTLRKSWVFEIVEYGDVSLDALRPYLARADVEKAIRAFVLKGGRDLKGVRIFEEQKAMVR